MSAPGAPRPRWLSRRNLWVGWSLLWRVAVVMLPLHLLARLISSGSGPAQPAAAVAVLFALPVGGNAFLIPIAIPVMLAVLQAAGRQVVQRELGVPVRSFIGWSLYWRWALLSLAGILVLGLAAAAMVQVAGGGGGGRQAMGLMAGVGLVLLPALFVWNLNAAGWSLQAVARRLPVGAEAEVEGAARVEATTRLDRSNRSYLALFPPGQPFNWLLALAYALAGMAMPLVWAMTNALLGGQAGLPPPGEYASLIMFSVLDGAALAYLSLACRRAGVFILATGTASLLVSAVQLLSEGAPAPVEQLLVNAPYGFLVAAGLVLGVRLWGARLRGFVLGLLVCLLPHALALRTWIHVRYVLPGGMDPELARQALLEGLLLSAVVRTLGAVLTGALLYAAVQMHARRRAGPAPMATPADSAASRP